MPTSPPIPFLYDVAIIGLGGLGCPVVDLLLRAAPNLRLVLCDGDVVDESNLARQHAYGLMDVGRRKASVWQTRAPGVSVCGPVGPQDLNTLLGQSRLVVEATDQIELKFALSDAALAVGRPCVIGAVTGLDGYSLSVDAAGSSACMRCIFEAPTPDMAFSCADAGVLATAPRLVGTAMATQALELLDNQRGDFWSTSLKQGRSVRRQLAPTCPRHRLQGEK